MRLHPTISFILILALAYPADAQTMIGLSKTRVGEIISSDYREFRKDNTIVRQQFNYLKYVNRLGTKTWILFFTDDDICKTSKLVCDYTEYDDVLEDLSDRADKQGESVWEYVGGTDTFRIEVIKEEWYFTVRETRKEDS